MLKIAVLTIFISILHELKLGTTLQSINLPVLTKSRKKFNQRQRSTRLLRVFFWLKSAATFSQMGKEDPSDSKTVTVGKIAVFNNNEKSPDVQIKSDRPTLSSQCELAHFNRLTVEAVPHKVILV